MKTGKTKLKTSAGVLAQDPHRVQLDKERNL